MKYLLFAFLAFPLNIYSEDINLNLEKAWQITLSNNNNLKAIEYEKNQAEYSYLSSINSYLPQISLSHNFSRSGSDNISPINKFSTQASINQNIFNLKTISSIKISKLSYETSVISYEIALCELRKAFYTAYLNLYFSQENVEVNKRILEIRQENAKLIKLKYESGLESKGNMLYAQAQAQMAELNLRTSQRTLENYMDNLSYIMGIKRNGKIVVSGDFPLPELKINSDKVNDYISFYPDIKIYLKNIETSKEKLLSAKYDAIPTLKFDSSIGYSGNNEFPKNKNWSMSLSLNLPLFSNGLTYYLKNKIALENALKSNEKKYEDAVFSFEKDLKTSYIDYLNARDSVITYKILMEANEERYKEGQIKYMSGKMSFIDLENLEQNMIDSRLNYIQYMKNAHLKKINLERLLGIKTLEGVI